MEISEKIKQWIVNEEKKKKNKTLADDVEKVSASKSNVETLSSDNKLNDDENYKRAQLLNKIQDYKKEQQRISEIPDVTFEEVEYVPKTDDEILKEATDGLGDYYVNKQKVLEEKKNNQINNYREKISDKEKAAAYKKAEINAMYDDYNKTVSNNALKRGIQRSSIVSEQIKDGEKSKISNVLKVDDDLNNQLKSIENLITEAENAYYDAVSDLDLKKALELSDSVKKLKDEESKKRQEIERNNEKSLENAIKANEILNKEKSDEIISYKGKILGEVLQYFYAMPKNERYAAFKGDDELKELLGDYYDYVDRYLKSSN